MIYAIKLKRIYFKTELKDNPQDPKNAVGVFPGWIINVKGKIKQEAKWLTINLRCGPGLEDNNDIACQLNFRFKDHCVARNHRVAMKYGKPENGGGMPLKPGDSFEAKIQCEPNCMKIFLNGKYFCEFLHRIEYGSITCLTVDGDVKANPIIYEDALSHPKPIHKTTPFVKEIPDGIFPGREIKVQGEIPFGAEIICIIFQCGPATNSDTDIALHIQFLFEALAVKQASVVRNHRKNRNWGEEDIRAGMPLKQGSFFEVLIGCHEDVVKITLNKKHFYDFSNRLSLQQVSHVCVDGDVYRPIISC